MAPVTVTPEQFTYVDYDRDEIAAIAEKLIEEIPALAGAAVSITVDDSVPLPRVRVDSLGDGGEPIALHIEGGAFEDPTEPRHLSPRLTAEVIGRVLLRVADRRSGRFDDAPGDADLTLQQQVAWDAHCLGRLERLGYDVRPARRRYHFRTRHGFNDVADRVFDRLWAADELAWADIDAACLETASVRAERQPA